MLNEGRAVEISLGEATELRPLWNAGGILCYSLVTSRSNDWAEGGSAEHAQHLDKVASR